MGVAKNQSLPNAAAAGHAWVCDYCARARYRRLDKAEEHEKVCRTKQKRYHRSKRYSHDHWDMERVLERARDMCLPLEQFPQVAPANFAWICDFCQKAKFRTLNEAKAHEKVCRRKQHSRSNFHTAKRNSLQKPYDICLPEHHKQSFPHVVAPTGFAWFCDFCRKAKFRQFSEAEAHEKVCRINRKMTFQASQQTHEKQLNSKKKQRAKKYKLLIPPPTVRLQSKLLIAGTCVIDQPLSESDREQLHHVWVLLSQTNIKPQIIAQKKGDIITSADFSLLRPPEKNRLGDLTYDALKGAWVNKKVVHYYIKHTLKLLPSSKKYDVISPNSVEEILSPQHGKVSNRVLQLFKGNSLQLDLCFIPIHDQGKHWALVAVFPKERIIKYFDSCGKTNRCYLSNIKAFMEHCHDHHQSMTQDTKDNKWETIRCPWKSMKQENSESKVKLLFSRRTVISFGLS